MRDTAADARAGRASRDGCRLRQPEAAAAATMRRRRRWQPFDMPWSNTFAGYLPHTAQDNLPTNAAIALLLYRRTRRHAVMADFKIQQA